MKNLVGDNLDSGDIIIEDSSRLRERYT